MIASTREEIRLGPIAIRFLVEGAESNGTIAMFEFDVAANARVPAAHSHDAYEETIFGLAGTMTWTVDGATIDVGPGDVLVIRRGVVHQFANAGDVDATALAVVTPGILGPDYFRELAEVAAAAAGGPPDLVAIEAIMRRHGLTPA